MRTSTNLFTDTIKSNEKKSNVWKKLKRLSKIKYYNYFFSDGVTRVSWETLKGRYNFESVNAYIQKNIRNAESVELPKYFKNEFTHISQVGAQKKSQRGIKVLRLLLEIIANRLSQIRALPGVSYLLQAPVCDHMQGQLLQPFYWRGELTAKSGAAVEHSKQLGIL
jgi:hypothetical protein